MIRALTGLRSILFLLIFCTHFRIVINDSPLGKSLFEVLFLGRYGVLFFFLLSGFCVALGYSEVFSALSFKNIVAFLKKRLLKLYPLYLLTGLVFLLYYNIPQYGIRSVYLFLTGYVPMIQSLGFINIENIGNGVAWFISCLFFCYLFTPLILFFLSKIRSLKCHILFCLVNYLILLRFSFYLASHYNTQNLYFYILAYVRIFEYMIALDTGIIFKKFVKDKINIDISYLLKSIIDIFFVAVFIACIYGLPNDLITRHSFAMPLFCCFLIYLCYEKRSILYDFLNSKFCIFIGSITYECYLIHYPIFKILEPYYQIYTYTPLNLILLFIFLFVISVLISYLYKIVQDKFFLLFVKQKK